MTQEDRTRRLIYSVGKLVLLLWGVTCAWWQVVCNFIRSTPPRLVQVTTIVLVAYVMQGFIADQLARAWRSIRDRNKTD